MVLRSDWQELGIEPSDNVIAIKRAYALRLRTTRPDDDAAAYQRLREAYDRALKGSGRRRDGSASEDEASQEAATPRGPDAAPGLADVDVDVDVDDIRPSNGGSDGGALSDDARKSDTAPDDPDPDESDAGDFEDDDEGGVRTREEHATTATSATEAVFMPSADAVDALVLALTASDEAAVMIDAWPDIRRRLEALPLWASRRASMAFADLALDKSLPVELLASMSEYFGWIRDFRFAESLGSARSAELLALLDRALKRSFEEPGLREKYRNVLRLDDLLARQAYLRAALLAIAVGPLQLVLEGVDGAALERRVRSPPRRITMTFVFATRARMVLLLGVVAALGALLGADMRAIGVGVGAVVVWWFGSLGLVKLLLQVFPAAFRLVLSPALRARLTTWRERTMLPVIGCVGLCAGSIVFADAATSHPPQPVKLLVAMLALPFCLTIAWPKDGRNALFGVAFALYVGIHVQASVRDEWLLCAFVSALAWACLSAWVLDNMTWPIVARSADRLQRWRSAGPIQRSLVGLALLVPSVPLMCMRLSRAVGIGMVLAGFGIGVGLEGMRASIGLQRSTPFAIAAVVVMLPLLHLAAIRSVDALYGSAVEP